MRPGAIRQPSGRPPSGPLDGLMLPLSHAVLWNLTSTTGNSVTCTLWRSPRFAVVSVAIGGTDIVVERFPEEMDARRFAKQLHADFVSQGCVERSESDGSPRQVGDDS